MRQNLPTFGASILLLFAGALLAILLGGCSSEVAMTTDEICSESTGGCDLERLCGNGILDEVEICEGDDLAGATCESLEHSGGTLSCTESCTLDASACHGDFRIASVEGGLTDGGSLRISGVGFGQKSPTSPLIWDTFESGVLGEMVRSQNADIGTWSGENDLGFTFGVTYTDEDALYGAKSAKHYFTTTNGSALIKEASFEASYVNINFRFAIENGERSDNLKVFRWYGFDDFGGQGTMTRSASCDSKEMLSAKAQSYPEVCNGSYGDSGPFQTNTWLNISTEWKMNTDANTGDAILKSWYNGERVYYSFSGCPDYDLAEGPEFYLRADDSDTAYEINIMNYNRLSAQNAGTRCEITDGDQTIYTDNIYIDNTLARVELKQNSDYDAPGITVPLLPNSWTANEITADIWLPSTWTTGTRAWLFVTDENGRRSSGFPVTIGKSNP